MKKNLLLLAALFCAVIVFAQAKPKPAQQPVVPQLTNILTGSGLPFKIINDSVAVIPYGGENIASYDVVVQKIGDLYIVYTNLSEDLPGKLDATKYKYLLQQTDHFDIIKIGMDSDGVFYLRADVYKMGISTAILTRVIKQVANVTNIIGGDFK